MRRKVKQEKKGVERQKVNVEKTLAYTKGKELGTWGFSSSTLRLLQLVLHLRFEQTSKKKAIQRE